MISYLTQSISDSISTVTLSSHQDYQSYNPFVCMIKQPQYVWHHMNFIQHHIHSLWYHTTLWHHTHCIHAITPNISDITSTIAASLLRVYWLYHIYLCVTSNTLYVWQHMNAIWRHTHWLWHHKNVFMTSHPLFSWHHTHCIWDHIHSTCDITAIVYMKRHLLCLWHQTQYTWRLIECMNDNTATVSDITPTVFV